MLDFAEVAAEFTSTRKPVLHSSATLSNSPCALEKLLQFGVAGVLGFG